MALTQLAYIPRFSNRRKSLQSVENTFCLNDGNAVVSQGYSEHLRTYCSTGSDLLTSDWNLWTIVGEFTVAHTDCE